MIKIYTFQFNNPDFLEYQLLTFKKFIKEDFELICINNSFDKEHEKEAIRQKCQELSIPHYIPEGVDHRQAGWSHQTALNWVWKKFIVDSSDIAMLVDHDIFFIRNFVFDHSYDFIGIAQGRGDHIKYLHPGFMVIKTSALLDKHTIDFKGEKIDGYDCDSGGNFWHYWKSHPGIKVKGLSMVNICEEQGNMHILPKEAIGAYYEGDCIQICDNFAIHFRGGSNWQQTEENKFNRKLEQLKLTLNYYMSL